MAVESADFHHASGARDEGAIPLLRPTITAFIGRTAAGPVNEPVRVRSLAEFQRVFGGQCSFSFVPQAVQQYFQHGGGEALVVRVANRATRARLEIPAGEHALMLEALEPGSEASLRASVDHERVETQRDRFNLVVQRLAGHDSQRVRDQEIFRAVSINPGDPRFIGTLLEESKLVRLSGPVPGLRPRITEAPRPGEPLPYIATTQRGYDGEALTDYDIVGSNAELTGLFALERAARFDVLCIPPAPGADFGATSFVAAERYCRRRNALLIWDPPESWTHAGDAVSDMRAGTWTSRNAVLYFPRIRRRGDAFRVPAGMPACGAVAGGIARADSCGVWARDSASGVALKTSLTPVAAVAARDAAALRRFGVNVLETPAGRWTSIEPRVTAAGPGAPIWRDFHLRRLLLFVLGSVEQTAVEAAQRRRDTGRRLEAQIDDFLRGLHERGAFAGTTPAQAWYVRAGGDSRDRAPIRFGMAFRRGGEFASFELELGDGGPLLRALPAVEVDELTS